MELTLQQIQDAITADAELRKGVLTTVVGTTEGKELVANAQKSYWEENITKKIGETYGHFDLAIKEELGEEKPGDKKTSDFVREKLRELKTLKTSGGNNAEYEKLKKELEEIKKDPNRSTHWHDTYHKEVKTWEQKMAEKEAEIAKFKSEQLGGTIRSRINEGIAGLKFNEAIPEEARKAMIEATVAKIAGSAKIEGEAVVFYKPDGTIWKNPDYSTATAAQILNAELKAILATEVSGGGAAAKNTPGEIIKVGEGSAAVEKLLLDKSLIKSQYDFMQLAEKTLREQGIPKNDKRYQAIIDVTYKEMEVGKLPIK